MNQHASPPALEYTGERMVPGHHNFFAFERIYRLVAQRYPCRHGSALDYGCGSGYGTVLLREGFKQVTGIDVSQESIDFCLRTYASEDPPVHFATFDPARQPFPDATFDAIFSFQVFEHIPLDQTEAYIRYIWNMLRPGGVAVVTTPNAHNYHGGFSGNPFHVKEYTSHELRDAFLSVLSPDVVSVHAVSDVASTRARIWVKRALRNRPGSQRLSHLAAKPFRLLEKAGVIKNAYQAMLHTDRIDHIIGSYYVEVSKPLDNSESHPS